MPSSHGPLANLRTEFSPASAAEARTLPAQVDKYLLGAEIGRGGMGTVYEGHDPLLERDVAIKLVLPRPGEELSRSRLLREARAAARLNHPNTVTVYDAGEFPGGVFIAMERVRGISAWEHLQRHGVFTWQEATRIVVEICQGLAAAHASGLVHRDIKPANILLVDDAGDDAQASVTLNSAGGYRPRAKLADFGLSRTLDGAASGTLEGRVVGTAHYMSPEQIRGERVDERSDIYSLGAAYYTLLTGRYPFEREQVVQVLFAHCSAPRPNPCDCDSAIPPAIGQVVMQAMAKEPRDRFPSALALAERLRELLPESGGAAVAATSRRRRRSSLSIGVGAAAVVLVAAGAAIVWRGSVGSPAPVGAVVSRTDIEKADGGESHDAPSRVKVPLAPGEGVIPVDGEMECLRLAPDGRTLAWGISEGEERYGRLTLVDLTQGVVVETYPQPYRYASLSGVAFLGTSQVLVTCSEGVLAYDRQSGQETLLLKLSDGTPYALDISPDCRQLLVGIGGWKGGGRAELHDVERREGGLWLANRRAVTGNDWGAVRSVAFAPNGAAIAVADEAGGFFICDPQTGTARVEGRLPDPIAPRGEVGYALAWSPDGKQVAVGGHRGVVLLDVATGERQILPAEHARGVSAVAFSSDGQLLASAATDGIRLWNVAEGWQVGPTLQGHEGNVINGLAFCDRNTRLISSGFDRRIRFWSLVAIGRGTAP